MAILLRWATVAPPVIRILDVPLPQSPPVTLSGITSSGRLPTLETPGLEGVATAVSTEVAAVDKFADDANHSSDDDWDDEFGSDECFATVDDGFKPS